MGNKRGANLATVRPYLHALAELPGSTPDDIHLQNHHAPIVPNPSKPHIHSDGKSLPNLEQMPLHPTIPIQNSQGMCENTADAPKTRSPDRPSSRRSFDKVSPSISTLDQKARKSFDLARPRAHSEQITTRRSFEVRNHASHDQVRPMPTLSERPIERLNSTASIALGDAVSISLSSMRHGSKTIIVEKPMLDRGSRSSALPQFPSQTSLMDDLSTRVTPQSVHASYYSYESNQSVDTATSVTTSTPATSATSSPIVPRSSSYWPPALIDTTSTISMKDSDGPSGPSDIQNLRQVSPKYIPALPSRPAPSPPVPPKVPMEVLPQSDTTEQIMSHENLQRSDSAPIPPPLRRRRRPTPAPRKVLTEEESLESLPKAASWPSTTAPANSTPPRSDANREEEPCAIPNDNSPLVSSQESKVHKNALHHLTSSASATDKYPIAYTPIDISSTPDIPTTSFYSKIDAVAETGVGLQASSAASSTSAVNDTAKATHSDVSPPIPGISVHTSSSSAVSVETLTTEAASVPDTSPPMTALAKRRAAHAKRMQMAFGTDSENT